MNTYKTVMIDPPWPQSKSGLRLVRPNQERALDYPIMTLDEIRALPIRSLCDGLVFLWTIDKFMVQAHQILKDWGFKKHCIFVWNKSNGMCPFSVRFTNEYMLMGYTGKLTLKKIGVSTHFSGASSRHSEKPEEAYKVIETIAFPPYLEMFARRERGKAGKFGATKLILVYLSICR